MKRDEKLLKEFEDLNFDPFQSMYFVLDLACSISELKNENIVYSKKFFTHYYCINGETFCKWIKIFCPDLASSYKAKRKFSNEEAAYIFENLGSLPYKYESLIGREEAMKAIYGSYNWKKSRQYEEFSLLLLDRFPNVDIKLNKLPPKLMLSILIEEKEDLEGIRVSDRDISYEKRINTISEYFKMYKAMSPHAWEVRRRWFRRFMNAKA